MNVKDKLKTSDMHFIEWGEATWNIADRSIRNRYNSSSGRFNKTGSSEIPWNDFTQMIHESIRRNHLSNAELGAILDEISNRLKKI